MNKQVNWAIETLTKFNYGDPKRKKNNDIIFQNGDYIIWMYHGNAIAKINLKNETVTLSLAGYPTKTTMERLNTLCNKLGMKGYPFKGYGTRRYEGKPKFMEKLIDDWHQEFCLKLIDIIRGLYNSYDK